MGGFGVVVFFFFFFFFWVCGKIETPIGLRFNEILLMDTDGIQA